ncbi:MAG: hypothetical protein ABUT20_29415 [Bacteroidota bacterium]
MKAKILLYVLTLLTCILEATTTGAQDTSKIKSLAPVVVKASTKKIPNRIWKGFSTYFNNAENPRWYTLNKNYLAKFMIYDEENRALFTKRGNLIYHISYGYEKSLPEHLRNQVKSSYSEYEITRAVKVEEAGREIWVVNLEDTKKYILIRLEDGELEEIETLNKSS